MPLGGFTLLVVMLVIESYDYYNAQEKKRINIINEARGGLKVIKKMFAYKLFQRVLHHLLLDEIRPLFFSTNHHMNGMDSYYKLNKIG